jgi:Bacterial membrane protein YfhO
LCDGVALVSALANSVTEPQAGTIARLHFYATNGRVFDSELRAGIDTAEWAIDSPNVRGNIKHQKAKIFDSRPEDNGSYQAYRFWSLVKVGVRLELGRIEIENVSKQAELLIWKASLYDSQTQRSIPLPHYDEKKWRRVYDANNILILENPDALPRAWLVNEAEQVSSEEALRRIRGESLQAFDPRRTALIEIPSEQLKSSPSGAAPNIQLLKDDPNHQIIETSAEVRTVLVVSEINYPGWRATIDGAELPVITVDYLLRGAIVPAGKHRIEMYYTAPWARRGAIISALALGLTFALGIFSRRRSTRRTGVHSSVF